MQHSLAACGQSVAVSLTDRVDSELGKWPNRKTPGLNSVERQFGQCIGLLGNLSRISCTHQRIPMEKIYIYIAGCCSRIISIPLFSLFDRVHTATSPGSSTTAQEL